MTAGPARIVAPLRLEALAVGGTRIGMRSRRPLPPGPLLLAGVAGAVVPGLAPGDIVVADRVLLTPAPFSPTLLSPTLPPDPPDPADPVDPVDPLDPADPADPSDPADPAAALGPGHRLHRAAAVGAGDRPDRAAAVGAGDRPDPAAAVGEVVLAGAADIARALRIAGLRVHLGPVGGADRVVTGAARAVWAERGALAVDMESATLARTGRLAAVVRAIVDTPVHPLVSFGTLPRGAAALRALRRAAPVLSAWAAGRAEPDAGERPAAPVDITITLPGEVETS